jgi:hypothetical protein
MARSKYPTGSKQQDAVANSLNLTSTEPVKSGTTQTEPSRADAKKVLGVVKSESRPQVVPINLDDEIRRRAYELAEQRGFSGGHETEDWLTAEREVLQRYRQQSA